MLNVPAHQNSELTRPNTSTPMTRKITLRKLTTNSPTSHKGTTGQLVLQKRPIRPDIEKVKTIKVAVKKRQAKPNIEIENPSSTPKVQEKQVKTVPITTHAPNVTVQATSSAVTLREDMPCSAAQKTEIVRRTTPNDNYREKNSIETASDEKARNMESGNDEKLAALFESVTVAALEKMFGSM